MLPHLSAVTILAVALWILLEVSFTTGQAQYRLTQVRPGGRPMKLPQLRSGPECPSPYFPNGVAKLRQRNKMVRFTCSSGFVLVGNMYSMCEKGRWDTPVPLCIRSGCPELAVVDNGQISYEYNQAAGMLFCNTGYQVAGPAKTYCNGTHWDRPLGSCRLTEIPVETSCDFEVTDFCGWMNEATHDFDWIRSDGVLSPKALKTGPKNDHTSMTPLAGHFLMVDSSQQLTNETARLMSPLYPANYSTDACFLFYYHMFGDNVGTLSVYVKPVSRQLDSLNANDALFSLRGNQRNIWNEGYFDVKQHSEDFQIIIEASLGMKFKSDIAIDDVSLLNGEDCRPKPDGEGQPEASSDTPEKVPPEEPVDEDIFKIDTCENRCGKNVSTVVVIGKQNFIHCDCIEGCVETKTCCPDYAERCVYNDNSDSKDVESSSTTPASTPTSTTSTSTPTTTPVKTTPTTTPSTTSTTTPRTTPSTTTKPTTQSTTTKRTTTSTTTSTTTQRPTTTSTTSTTTSTTSTSTKTTKSTTTTTTKIYNLRPRTSTSKPLIGPMIRTRARTTPTTTATSTQPTTEEVELKLEARFQPSVLELSGDSKPNLGRVFLFTGLGVVAFGTVVLLIVVHIRRNSGANVLSRLKQKSKKKNFGSSEGFEDVRFLAADEHLDFSVPDDDAEEAVESEQDSDAENKAQKKGEEKAKKKGKK